VASFCISFGRTPTGGSLAPTLAALISVFGGSAYVFALGGSFVKNNFGDKQISDKKEQRAGGETVNDIQN
jgi:hypothetical protein